HAPLALAGVPDEPPVVAAWAVLTQEAAAPDERREAAAPAGLLAPGILAEAVELLQGSAAVASPRAGPAFSAAGAHASRARPAEESGFAPRAGFPASCASLREDWAALARSARPALRQDWWRWARARCRRGMRTVGSQAWRWASPAVADCRCPRPATVRRPCFRARPDPAESETALQGSSISLERQSAHRASPLDC